MSTNASTTAKKSRGSRGWTPYKDERLLALRDGEGLPFTVIDIRLGTSSSECRYRAIKRKEAKNE
jgi:hypothetical protein